MKMPKKTTSLLLATILVVLTGCSSHMEMEPKTNVVEIDGVPANELVEMLGLDNTFEVSVDPDTGAVSIDGTPVNELIGRKKGIDSSEDKTEDTPENEDKEEFKDCGVTLTLPARFKDILGVTESMGDEIGFGNDIYIVRYVYGGISAEWLASLEETTEEDDEKIDSCVMDLPSVWCAKKGTDLSEIIDIAKDDLYTLDEELFSKVCETDGYVFYSYFEPDQKNYDNLDPDFRDEFDDLCDIMDEAIKNADYYKPVNIYEDLIGTKLEFTTTDLDGSRVSSKELFSGNEITMINIWATWCPNCIDELSGLDRINRRLAKKDCAVIGLLGDGVNDELIELGKSILRDHDADYENIVPWEGALDKDLIVSCWPVTYFVDKNGTILSKPILGAKEKIYEKAVDSLLKDRDNGETVQESSTITPNGLNEYRVYVTDTDSNPVEGVRVQLCDDSTCRLEKTDADGLAVFDSKKNDYEVHLLNIPKGYRDYTDVLKFTKEYSDLKIILEKEQ